MSEIPRRCYDALPHIPRLKEIARELILRGIEKNQITADEARELHAAVSRGLDHPE